MKHTVLPFAVAALLAGCATTPAPPSPVQVTRFHDSAALSVVEGGTVFVETAPGSQVDGLTLSPYKAAVAAELAELGYVETARESAAFVVQIGVEKYLLESDGDRRRGPVSVGVGGSTGSYGSGVGMGIGINLGGGRSTERAGTDVTVMLRDTATNAAVWEGRAQFSVGPAAELASPQANASIIADALFQDFPGGNGETIEIEVNE